MEKQREAAEVAREDARLRGQDGGGAGRGRGGGGDEAPGEPKGVVVDAWEKARLDAEEAKRSKFAAKRAAGAAASPGPAPPQVPGVAWGEGPPFGGLASHNGELGGVPPGEGGYGGPGGGGGGFAPPPALQVHMQPQQGGGGGGGRTPTPLVVEKVRAVAAAELAAVKQVGGRAGRVGWT